MKYEQNYKINGYSFTNEMILEIPGLKILIISVFMNILKQFNA